MVSEKRSPGIIRSIPPLLPSHNVLLTDHHPLVPRIESLLAWLWHRSSLPIPYRKDRLKKEMNGNSCKRQESLYIHKPCIHLVWYETTHKRVTRTIFLKKPGKTSSYQFSES